MTRDFMARYEKELAAWGRGEEVEWRPTCQDLWRPLTQHTYLDCGVSPQLRLKPKPREFWAVLDESKKQSPTSAVGVIYTVQPLWELSGNEVVRLVEPPKP